MTYPLSLQLAGRTVVVVGGGTVALRRVTALVAAGAQVIVIAPEFEPTFSELEVTCVHRTYRHGDLDGAWLVQIATNDPEVNAAVARDAERARIWSVRADDARASAALTPASTTVAEVTVAVTSTDPRRSVAVRDAVAAQLRSGDLPIKARRPHGGQVVLVGAGPGDPDLMTIRARRELNAADVVVYDRLAPLDALMSLDDDVELIDASKSPGHHAMTQDQINDVIVDRALAGKAVVRLKGGDPFVFGRGGEEVAACTAAGIPCQVVPGVSSVIAAATAAGIPVTHRGLAHGVAVFNGQVDLPLGAIADPLVTVVIVMGMSRLGILANQLLAAGRDRHTPAAVIERAWTPAQRLVTGTLDDIHERASAEHVSNPAVIVFGDVVNVAAMSALVAVAN